MNKRLHEQVEQLRDILDQTELLLAKRDLLEMKAGMWGVGQVVLGHLRGYTRPGVFCSVDSRKDESRHYD
jgi:hypothetical protein